MQTTTALTHGARRCVQLLKHLWHRYKALPTLAKIIIWAIVIFDLTVLGLLMSVGPSKVTQAFYDFGQELANFRFGWLILGSVLGTPYVYTFDCPCWPFLTNMNSYPVFPSSHVLYYSHFALRLRLWHERLLHSRPSCNDRLCINICDSTIALQEEATVLDVEE